MNTLFYHYGALGDFITVLPTLALWKKLHSGTVTLLGKTEHGMLARASGLTDSVLDADSGRYRFIFRSGSSPQLLTSFLNRFDAAFLFAHDNSEISLNFRDHFSGRLFSQPPFPSEKKHVIDYHLSLITETTPGPEDRIPRLSTISADIRPSESAFPHDGKPVILLHPGSGSFMKNWPFEHFLTLAATLRGHDYTIIWITGPAEDLPAIPEEDFHLRNRPYSEYLAVFRHCHRFIGNDSGMTHLAAAAGCDVISLFGPSDPVQWAPRGTGRITVIHHPPEECSPCHRQSRRASRCNGTCMSGISPGEVLSALHY